jgi:hypothetical protein
MVAEIPLTGNNLGSTLTGVANLANLFLGSSTQIQGGGTVTNSGGTTTVTTSESVAPGAVDAVVKSILEGTAGLASVAGGQRTAGLYNSSTNNLMVNDLVARAAAEGAKLNRTSTQTTVAPQTTQNTSQNQTNTKAAAIDPGVGLGGLALLQMIPKDVKDSVLKGISFGTRDTASSGASVASDVIADAYSDPSRSLDVLDSVATAGTDGLGEAINGVSDITGFGDFSRLDGADADYAAQEIAGLGDIGDGGGDGIVDALSGLDGAGIADSLGGFISGVGDTLGEAADSVGSFFDDFSFADGGIVNVAAHRAKYADGGEVSKGRTFQQQVLKKRMNDAGEPDVTDVEAKVTEATPAPAPANLTPTSPEERKAIFSLVNVLPNLINTLIGTPAPATSTPTAKPVAKADGGKVQSYANGGHVTSSSKPKGYANGGTADTRDNPVYDLRNVGYLTNTGLRPDAATISDAQTSGSNDAVISRIIRDTSRVLPRTTAGDGTPLQVAASGNQSITGYNSSAGGTGNIGSSESATSVGTGDVGSVAGLAGALGVSQDSARSGVNALGSISGLSGITGLATSRSNTEAAKSAGITALGIMSPPLGLIASIANAIAGRAEAAATENARMAAHETFRGLEFADMSLGISDSGPSGSDVTGGVGGSAGDANAGEGGTGAGDGSGVDGGSATAANGGEISGPGTGTSDSIPARLSDGEYVISADVVEALGVPFFDKLQKQYHTPVATGKRA